MPSDFAERVNRLAEELGKALRNNVSESLERDKKGFWGPFLGSVAESSRQVVGLATLAALATSGVVGMFASPEYLSSAKPELLADALTRIVPAGQGALGFWMRDFAVRLSQGKVRLSNDKERQDAQVTETARLIDELSKGNLLSSELLIGLSRLVHESSLLDGMKRSQVDDYAVQQAQGLVNKIEKLSREPIPFDQVSGFMTEIVADAKKVKPLLENTFQSLSFDVDYGPSGGVQHPTDFESIETLRKPPFGTGDNTLLHGFPIDVNDRPPPPDFGTDNISMDSPPPDHPDWWWTNNNPENPA